MNDVKITARKVAETIWFEVLEAMPKHLQSRYALVEARRRLIGMDNGDMVSAELDSLAASEFGQDQLGEASAPMSAPEPPGPGTPAQTIEEAVRLAVCKGFEGTIYDTTECVAGVEARALEEAEQVIRSDKQLNWLRRRHLRAIARAEAAAQLRSLRQR